MGWPEDITAARKRTRAYIRQTPVIETEGFGLDFPIGIKFEQMQHTGSFKARGAFNTLLGNPVPEAGLVAASGGNHGAAVAYAAARLGHKARIYVPELAGAAKTALIRAQGAELKIVKGTYAEAAAHAVEWQAATGAMQIHAYDAAATVAGQGTVMAEWEDQGLEADTVLIAVGGGGLIAGALGWLGGRRKVVAVEPQKSCALHAAQQAGAPVDVDVSGIAANALGAKRIGDICFDLARDIPTMLVSDRAIATAQTALWRELRQWVEPAGATALAALISGAYQPEAGERVAVLICGGNPELDPTMAGAEE